MTFAQAYRKNKKTVETVKELIDYLGEYPPETPLESGFSDGVVVLVHENTEDPEDFSICIEEVDEFENEEFNED